MNSAPPDVVGLPLTEAQRLLESVGLAYELRMTEARRLGPGQLVFATTPRIIQQRASPAGTVLVVAYPLQAPEER